MWRLSHRRPERRPGQEAAVEDTLSPAVADELAATVLADADALRAFQIAVLTTRAAFPREGDPVAADIRAAVLEALRSDYALAEALRSHSVDFDNGVEVTATFLQLAGHYISKLNWRLLHIYPRERRVDQIRIQEFCYDVVRRSAEPPPGEDRRTAAQREQHRQDAAAFDRHVMEMDWPPDRPRDAQTALIAKSFLGQDDAGRMAVIRSLADQVPWLIRKAEIRRALAARAADDGVEFASAKRTTLEAGVAGALAEFFRPSRHRFGSHEGSLKVTRTAAGLPSNYLMDWLRSEAVKAAEAHLLDEKYPAEWGDGLDAWGDAGSLSDDDGDASPDPLLRLLAKETIDMLFQLASPQQGEILKLVRNGYTQHEIARILGRARGSVAAQWDRFKAKLENSA